MSAGTPSELIVCARKRHTRVLSFRLFRSSNKFIIAIYRRKAERFACVNAYSTVPAVSSRKICSISTLRSQTLYYGNEHARARHSKDSTKAVVARVQGNNNTITKKKKINNQQPYNSN